MSELPIQPDGAPRWVKVSGIVAAVITLLAGVLLLFGGGPGAHGPDRHRGGDGPPQASPDEHMPPPGVDHGAPRP